MNDYKSFNLLNKIYFERTGGSENELKAANIILEEIKSLNASCYLEEFEVDGANIKNASVTFDDDYSIECVGVGMSGSTPLEGVTGEFIYITSLEDAKIQDVKGKICLVHSKLVNYKLYEELAKKKPNALILCCGNVYDDFDKVDLDPYMYRPRHYEKGKIPAVCIRMKDAEKLLRKKPKTCKVIMVEDELKNISHNVIAEIPGSTYPDEIIAITAHYDSVSYSKGAYDNGTGSTAIMQILSHFVKNKPLRTLKFIWCGSEEMGLLGSKAYTQAHKDDLDKYKLCVNIDMIGVTIGNDIACVTANNSLVSYLKYLGNMSGFPISVKQGVYSSDSTPFADSGVPALSFARLSPQGGAKIHSHDDVMDYLEEDNYYKTCDFIIKFVSNMDGSVLFPVEKEIPDNMKEEIDIYMGRKERNKN